MLEHSEVLFDYLVDATPVVATCPDATGRESRRRRNFPSLRPTSASNGIIASPVGDAAVDGVLLHCCILLGSSDEK